MITVIASHGELDGVQWHPATRECAVQWGYFGEDLVGREPHGKAVLLHVADEQVLDELLRACKSDIVIIAEGALEELGVKDAAIPVISGGSVAAAVHGAQALEKQAGKEAAVKEVAELGDKVEAAELATACSSTAAAIAEGEELPKDGGKR